MRHLYAFSIDMVDWGGALPIEEVEVCIENKLNIYLPWHKRLVIALKYFFIPSATDHGGYDSAIIDLKGCEALENFFREAKEAKLKAIKKNSAVFNLPTKTNNPRWH